MRRNFSALLVVFLLLSGGLFIEAPLHTRLDAFWIAVIGHFAAGLAFITLVSEVRLARVMQGIAWAVVAIGEAAVVWFLASGNVVALIGHLLGPEADWRDGSIDCGECIWVDISALTMVVLLVIVTVTLLRRLNEYLLSRERPAPRG